MKAFTCRILFRSLIVSLTGSQLKFINPRQIYMVFQSTSFSFPFCLVLLLFLCSSPLSHNVIINLCSFPIKCVASLIKSLCFSSFSHFYFYLDQLILLLPAVCICPPYATICLELCPLIFFSSPVASVLAVYLPKENSSLSIYQFLFPYLKIVLSQFCGPGQNQALIKLNSCLQLHSVLQSSQSGYMTSLIIYQMFQT